MIFIVYRCTQSPDVFIVTDEVHMEGIASLACPENDRLEKVGEFPEMGDKRAAFNETIAKNSIRAQGFYRFHAKTFGPVSQIPDVLPG